MTYYPCLTTDCKNWVPGPYRGHCEECTQEWHAKLDRWNAEAAERARAVAAMHPDLFGDDGDDRTVRESWEQEGTWSWMCQHGRNAEDCCLA